MIYHVITSELSSQIDQNILKNIRKKNIFISLRGETIRVSPSVYNKKEDVEKLFNCISKNI